MCFKENYSNSPSNECSQHYSAESEYPRRQNVCLIGDFNASDSNRNGLILRDFCLDNDMILSDKELLPNDSFTYVSDAHYSCSWIDHCMCTVATHNTITSIKILYDYFLSDHHPMSVWFNCNSLPKFNSFHSNVAKPAVHWKSATPTQLLKYQEETACFLNSVKLPVDAICCSNVMCQEQSHKDGIQFFYDEILRALKSACTKSLLRRKNKRKFKHCLGWNNTMKEQYTTSRNAYKKWLLVGKPKKGVHFSEMKAAKKKFKYAFRKRKRTLEQSKADAIASALISDSSGKSFWCSIRSIRTNAAKILPQSVDGINGEQSITNM